MNNKTSFLVGSSITLNILALILVFFALPIEKLSVLWFGVFICGVMAFIVALYTCKKKSLLTYINLVVAFAIIISFPLTYTLNRNFIVKKYKAQKTETVIIPSEFTPIKKEGIYDLTDDDSKSNIIYFTDGDRKANSEAEKIIISAIVNSKYNKRIYYYDLSKMPTREVNYVEKHFVPDGNSCVVRIKNGVLAGKIDISDINGLSEFLKRNV